MEDLHGTLFRYSNQTRLCAFDTNPSLSSSLIFIGGLTDSLLPIHYIQDLVKELEKLQISLIQPLLSSAHLGYGISSLSQDSEELDELISLLIKKRQKNTLFLLGHSTGAQDIIWYLNHGKLKHHISGAILQGAVSDREYMEFNQPEHIQKYLLLSKEMINSNKAHEFLPREADSAGAPMTPTRFISLAERFKLCFSSFNNF